MHCAWGSRWHGGEKDQNEPDGEKGVCCHVNACKPDSAKAVAGALCMHTTDFAELMLCYCTMTLAGSLVTHSAVHLFASAGKLGRRMDNIAEKHTQGFFIRTPATLTAQNCRRSPDQRPGASLAEGACAPAKATPSQRALAATLHARTRAKNPVCEKPRIRSSPGCDCLSLLFPRRPGHAVAYRADGRSHTLRRLLACWHAAPPRRRPREARDANSGGGGGRGGLRGGASPSVALPEKAQGREEEYEWDTVRCWRWEAGPTPKAALTSS